MLNRGDDAIAQPDGSSGALLTRRSLLLAGTALMATGCARRPGLDLLSKTVGATRNTDDGRYPRSPENILAAPYAQLGFRQGQSARAILVLSAAEGDRWEWLSLNRLHLEMTVNRVTATTGLYRDIARTAWASPDLAELYDPGKGRLADDRALRTIVSEPGQPADVAVESRFVIEEPETISILGQRADTLRIRETVDVPKWRWTAENFWWLSLQSKLAWRSRQHLTPDQPPLELEILKRPASGA